MTKLGPELRDVADVVVMTPRALTPRQKVVLDFITAYLQREGRSPSVREIGRALGIRSTNGVIDHLVTLERKGYLERLPNCARSLKLRFEPENPLKKALLDLYQDARSALFRQGSIDREALASAVNRVTSALVAERDALREGAA
jgi:SOS-response transcriptional repressor LexA